ncbi:MAG: V-type ATP synthase subunit A [Candidatus Hodarchaeales archaeon]|jgi:V/A-type H+-transporting ATPase subunit A
MSVSELQHGKIVRIAGPVVDIEGLTRSQLYELVRVGKEGLMGEIIKITKYGDKHIATAQIYEETAGLVPGEEAVAIGQPLAVELGPGLIEQIYDGIQRPLPLIVEETGDFIKRGVTVSPLDKTREFEFTPTAKPGDEVHAGQVIGTAPETPLITHKILVPPNIEKGTVRSIEKGKFNLEKVICVLETEKGVVELKMYQRWPVRRQRPFKRKEGATVPLLTGQRILDTFFPIAKGGTGAIPGAFGTGKTVTQHQLAKWSDAQVVVYIGCGERGNEMTEVLKEFPELIDPHSGEKLMKRTVLIANTSNMPVAAREASVYTGITIAEYYRDQGFDVGLMADSTSRWAEALREISGRLEEMPGEEGYPAYLASKIAEFYERAGRVATLNDEPASISVVGAVSPPGGDFSEPVTQNTLRTVRVFWALNKPLANARHFPAISWLESYSLYTDSLEEWFGSNAASDFVKLRGEAMALLQKEKELREIVQLIGEDALPESEKIILQTTRMIREFFLQQHSYSSDSYCPLDKQYMMLKAILKFHEVVKLLFDSGVPLKILMDIPQITELSLMKWKHEEEFEESYQQIVDGLEGLNHEELMEGSG